MEINKNQLTKVSLDEDINYVKDEKNYLKIESLERIHNTSFFVEIFRVIKAILFGIGIERSTGDTGLVRKIANSPRFFKIIARYLMFRWPHNEEKQKVIDYDNYTISETEFEFIVEDVMTRHKIKKQLDVIRFRNSVLLGCCPKFS